MWTTDSESHFDAHFAEYMGLLAPLFDLRDPCGVTELFEHICCLIQPSGVEGLDENPLLESTALIDDLSAFSRQDMPAHDFSHPRRTQARLALLSYCHLTEADFFYKLLVNLLRVKVGERWALSPFYDMGRPVGKKSADAGKRIPATPNQKIARVSDYAEKAGMPAIASVLKAIYLPDARNAVFHADYTISETEFHMIRGYYQSPRGYLTRDVPLQELLTIVDRCFAFFYALLNRRDLARGKLTHLKNKAIPFELRLKGLIEFLFEDDLVCGFRIYWPNGQHAQYTRTKEGAHAMNLCPQLEGLSVQVGIYANTPGIFSPLVEDGQSPRYTPAFGRSVPPHWPDDLQPLDLK
jgi:hypothetical protein